MDDMNFDIPPGNPLSTTTYIIGGLVFLMVSVLFFMCVFQGDWLAILGTIIMGAHAWVCLNIGIGTLIERRKWRRNKK